MDEVQAKLGELKSTMPNETYRQLCEETKRGRDAEVPLFEVKYIVNTIIGSRSLHCAAEDEGGVRCEEVSAVHTKIMRGECFRAAGFDADAAFIDGRLMLKPNTSELAPSLCYKPGKQFKFGKPHTLIEYSPYLTIYTILEIKPFTNKRKCT